MKFIFLGTPLFGAIILEGLIKNNYKPSLVITAPNKPVGRKQIITPSPVKIIAEKYNIPVSQPTKIKSRFISGINPDLGIVSAYGQIIPKEILKIPKYGFINIHPSLLPKYRGPSPIQTAILNGDKKTGLTIILIDEKIDHGPILAQREWEIPNYKSQITNKFQIPIIKITYKELSKKLAELSIELLVETIPKWISGEIKPQPQDESRATFTKIIRKEDGRIDWSKPAEQIERQIRAFYPWPGSFAFFKKTARQSLASRGPAAAGRRNTDRDSNKTLSVKILETEIAEKENPKKFSVKCGKNYLIIKKLQPEGKKPITGGDFKRGYGNIVLF